VLCDVAGVHSTPVHYEQTVKEEEDATSVCEYTGTL